ncbi:protein VACUOLELESS GAMETOPHYTES-like [Quercus suber]|uniref:protein VACUOLELESS GAMETOPHYTES-like n=1 Tax=Quercus suber TaxID=58331 RepID=UPI0032DF5EBC
MWFLVHNSCASLPRTLKVIRHKHLLHLTHSYLEVGLHQSDSRFCQLCVQKVNTNYGFYYCSKCDFVAHLDCAADYRYRENLRFARTSSTSSLSIESKHNCSCCDSKISPIFRCTTCEFALDFKCATLPQTARYKQHDHPFTLRYTAEDDSGEYYCDICEEERNLKHWFYYCANCDYPAHTKCILGENSNVK